MDPPALNRDFAAALGVSFPLLSDVGGRVGTLYGVYNPKGRNHERANVVIDASGVIRHIERGAAAIDPTGALRACQVIPQGR